MNKAICLVVGRIMRNPIVVTPSEEGKKPFVDLTVELGRRHYGNTSYAQRVNVRIFSKHLDEITRGFRAGEFVSVSGDADAFIEQVGDKTFANIRITASGAWAIAKIDERALPATEATCRD